MKNKKIISFILPLAAGILIAVLMISVLALVMTKYDLNKTVINVSVLIILLFVCMFTSFISAKFSLNKGIITGSLTSGILSIIFFIAIMSFNNFNIIPIFYISIPLNILAGAAGGIISTNLR